MSAPKKHDQLVASHKSDTHTCEANLPMAVHRDGCRLLHEVASEHPTLEDLLRGAVSSNKESTFGVGLVKLVVKYEDKTYRAQEVLFHDADECEVEGAEWVQVRSNTTLRHLLKKYGDRLLAYDASRKEVVLELFAIDVFYADSRSVRVLLRRN